MVWQQASAASAITCSTINAQLASYAGQDTRAYGGLKIQMRSSIDLETLPFFSPMNLSGARLRHGVLTPTQWLSCLLMAGQVDAYLHCNDERLQELWEEDECHGLKRALHGSS